MTNNKLPLHWLYSFVLPHGRQIFILLLLSLLASALVLVQPWLTKLLIDDGLLGGSFKTLLVMAVAIFLAGILSTVLTGMNRLLHTRLSGRILFALRESVYGHLQTLSPDFYARQRTGDILSRLDGDIAEIQRFAVDGLFASFSGILGLAGAVSMMFLLSWKLALLLLFLIPVQWLYLRYMRPRVERQTRRMRERSADITAFLAETLPAMKFIQTAVAEERELQQLRGLNRSFLKDLLNLQWIEFATAAVPSTLTAFTRLVAFITGGYWVIQGQLELGSLIAFTTYLAMAVGPVQTLLGMYMAWKRMQVSLIRVQELTSARPDITDSGSAAVPDDLHGEFRLVRLSFSYPTDTVRILDEADALIPAGSKVGIYGPSGIGKTTLVDLLLRHFQPDKGQLLIDGMDISSFDLRSWRRRIAVVAQDIILLRGSIEENIRYHNPTAGREQVEQAIAQSGLLEFIDSLPEGINTAIGERGGHLSGGQKQRIAIARALLQNPLLLIFDEATSAVDQLAEQHVMQQVDRLFSRVTRIIISHRETPMRDADWLLTIEQGKIIVAEGRCKIMEPDLFVHSELP